MSADIDIDREYDEYLRRMAARVGERGFGEFVKHEGRLVKKLRLEEFEPVYREYFENARAYFDSLERGDTINDVVVKVVRERAIELFLDSPV